MDQETPVIGHFLRSAWPLFNCVEVYITSLHFVMFFIRENLTQLVNPSQASIWYRRFFFKYFCDLRHCIKVIVFGVIQVCIQSKDGKMRTRITLNADIFYAVKRFELITHSPSTLHPTYRNTETATTSNILESIRS